MKREKVFISHITGEIYKMLVLKEKSDKGEEVYLKEYIENIFIETNGACYWSEYLTGNRNYTTITSIVAYLSENEVEYPRFRREVFKMLGLLNQINSDLEGDV